MVLLHLLRLQDRIWPVSINLSFFFVLGVNFFIEGNIAALSFPLFTQQMYGRLGIPWANTLFAFIALALMPIPFVSSHTHTLPTYVKKACAMAKMFLGSVLLVTILLGPSSKGKK